MLVALNKSGNSVTALPNLVRPITTRCFDGKCYNKFRRDGEGCKRLWSQKDWLDSRRNGGGSCGWVWSPYICKGERTAQTEILGNFVTVNRVCKVPVAWVVVFASISMTRRDEILLTLVSMEICVEKIFMTRNLDLLSHRHRYYCSET